MLLISGKSAIRRINISLHFIMVIIALFTLQISAILSEPNVGVNYGKSALLRELSGSHLLMSVYLDPPWLNERMDANGTLTYDGFHVNVFQYLADALNVTYSFVRAREDEVRKIGRKDASFNLLMRKEVNITSVFLPFSLFECTRADCTIPFVMLKSQLIVPWPDEESRIIAPLRPFQLEVWIILSTSIVFVTLAFTYLPELYKENTNQSQDLGPAAIYVLTGQGGWNQWKFKLSFRILQGTWCLASFVLLNAYSSTIISYLTASNLLPVAKTVEDVAHGHPQNIKLLTEKDGIIAARSLNATTGTYKILGDSLRQHPDSMFLDRLEGFRKLFTGKYAYFSAETRVVVYMDMAYKKANNTCRFTVSNADLSIKQTPFSLTYEKHWRYTDVVNHKLRWLTESGLQKYWRNKIMPNSVDKCQLKNYEMASAEKRVLTLRDIKGPFLFLLVGISVSILVFIIEMIVFQYRTNIST